MEEWEVDFEFLRVRHIVGRSMKKQALPDLQSILFLIGIQELGRWEDEFTKEEKQDLIHIATCRLMAYDDYYQFVGRDADGWPHYEPHLPAEIEGVDEQEIYLKKKVIQYFKELENENDGFDMESE